MFIKTLRLLDFGSSFRFRRELINCAKFEEIFVDHEKTKKFKNWLEENSQKFEVKEMKLLLSREFDIIKIERDREFLLICDNFERICSLVEKVA